MGELSTLDSLFNNLTQSAIGFDHAFRNVYRTPTGTSNFPPSNIVQNGDNVRIEMALAGYSESDVDIEYKDGILTVYGSRGEERQNNNGDEYIHRGIAQRAFQRSFTLADTVVVDEATFSNGILTIYMHNELPEHRRHRKISITSSNSDNMTDEREVLSEA